MSVGTKLILGFDGRAVQRGLAGISKSFGSLAMGGIGSIVKPFAQLSAMLAPTALIGGMVAFGKASSDAAANIENMKAAFEIFLGSESAVDGLIASLRKIAIESPLELTDISEGARMLLTYGVAADEVASTVERLSEVSAGSAERFGRISYAFGQISSIGRLMGTELRQLTEAGFNPLENIGKRTGETMIQLKDRMEKGGIAIDEVKQALADATSEGGRFFGINAKMAQTFSGRVSMMKDQWTQLLQTFGTGMNEGLKKAADSMTANLPRLQERFKTLGDFLGTAITDGMGGDFEKFATIGVLIGQSIAEGLKVGFKSASVSFGGMVLDAVGLSGAGDYVAKNQKRYMADLIAEAIENIKSQAMTIPQTNPGYGSPVSTKDPFAQPPMPPEKAPFSLNPESTRQLLDSLKAIENNTKTGSKM